MSKADKEAAPPAAPAKTIIEALSRAQGEMEAAAKDAANPHFKTKYADLASVMAAVRAPLARNGLAVTQIFAKPEEKGNIALETRLMHVSGEILSSVIELPVAQRSPQGVGSTITYARRYGLSALLGVVADEDDDGNAASLPATRPPQYPRQDAPKREAQAVTREEEPHAVNSNQERPAAKATPPQRRLVIDAPPDWNRVVDAFQGAQTTAVLQDLRKKAEAKFGPSTTWPEPVRAEYSMRAEALGKEGK